ncbi:hypothetical protein B0O99DRAFT_722436 [Bisporella sp. PMI_857]|nr:hypothetical protein B0O99DRAFT_722436 [Bisporella sp. PMI_857]
MFTSSLLPLSILASLAQSHPTFAIPAQLKRDLEIHRRTLSSTSVVIPPSGWGCSDSQIAQLTQAIADAKELATAASRALGVTRAERSIAYQFWFGRSNANAATRNAIKTNNYDALLADLVPPTDTVSVVTSTSFDPTGYTFACPSSTTICATPDNYAFTYENGANGIAGNIVGLCPGFFQLASQAQMITNFNRDVFTPSQGFAILHEVQHTTAIVGAARRCSDQNDATGAGCYSSQCCSSLPDSRKILNAQNMAFFAAQILADPSSGSPTSNDVCVIQKRSKVFGAPTDLYERERAAELLKRQAQSSRELPLPSTSSSLSRTISASTLRTLPTSRTANTLRSSRITSSSSTAQLPTSAQEPTTSVSSTLKSSLSSTRSTSNSQATTPVPSTLESSPSSRSTSSSKAPPSSAPPVLPTSSTADSPPATITSPPLRQPSSTSTRVSTSTDPGVSPPPVAPVPPPAVPPPAPVPVPVPPPGNGGGNNGGTQNPTTATTSSNPTTTRTTTSTSSSSSEPTASCTSSGQFPTGTVRPTGVEGLTDAQVTEILNQDASLAASLAASATNTVPLVSTATATANPGPSETATATATQDASGTATVAPSPTSTSTPANIVSSDILCEIGNLDICDVSSDGLRRCLALNSPCVCTNVDSTQGQ